MVRTAQDVTEAELALLQALWERGASTIRELVGLVYGDGGVSTYATVQKLLDRLESKGFVARDGGERPRLPPGGRPRRTHQAATPRGGRHALRRLARPAPDPARPGRSALDRGPQRTPPLIEQFDRKTPKS